MKKQINLLVIQIPQALNAEINKIRNKGFTKTGNPSFKMLEPYLILGIYEYDKFPKHINKLSQTIHIQKKAQCSEGLLYFQVDNKKNIIDELNLPLDENIYENLIPLEKLFSKNKYPLIFLASDIDTKETNSYNLNQDYEINDIRLNLLNIKFTDLGIIYSLLDYRHLSNCK